MAARQIVLAHHYPRSLHAPAKGLLHEETISGICMIVCFELRKEDFILEPHVLGKVFHKFDEAIIKSGPRATCACWQAQVTGKVTDLCDCAAMVVMIGTHHGNRIFDTRGTTVAYGRE